MNPRLLILENKLQSVFRAIEHECDTRGFSQPRIQITVNDHRTCQHDLVITNEPKPDAA